MIIETISEDQQINMLQKCGDEILTMSEAIEIVQMLIITGHQIVKIIE